MTLTHNEKTELITAATKVGILLGLLASIHTPSSPAAGHLIPGSVWIKHLLPCPCDVCYDAAYATLTTTLRTPRLFNLPHPHTAAPTILSRFNQLLVTALPTIHRAVADHE